MEDFYIPASRRVFNQSFLYCLSFPKSDAKLLQLSPPCNRLKQKNAIFLKNSVEILKKVNLFQSNVNINISKMPPFCKLGDYNLRY